MSLSVIQRILLGFGVLLVLLLTIAVAGFEGTNKVEDRLNVVTGKVSNIMVNSNKLRDDLALSNATVLQYLLSKSPESLDVLSQRFASLTTQYQEISSNLADDFQNSPMMQDALTKIDQEVDAFMQLTDVAFSNHKRMLELQATIPDEKLDLKDAINFTSEDLSFLQEGGDTSEIQFAASYMVSQAQSLQVTVNDYFDLRDLTSMQSLRDDMVSVIGSLREKQDYLKDDNINGLIDEVDVSVQSDDGVINKYFENTRLTQESEQLAKQLSDSMKLVDESVQLLLTEANQMATVAKEEASSAANLSRLVISVVFVVSIVIAILVALWVSRSIRSPLKEVMRVLGLISEGDFTQRSQVKTKDEFGELSGWVNGLVERLQKVMAEIDQSSTEVAASANSNVHIAGESKRLMGSQNERTTEVASSMSEMASTVEQVAKSSEFILHQIQSADQRTGQNRTQMDANIAKIEALLAQIEESTSVVNQLDEYSKNIDSILDVIQDIAEQTNLLALNAAIEAARAGEQGRGFAVVADEVRTLATRTHSSTEEIQRVIAQLQQGVKKAVGSMEESRQSATSSVGEARSVGESLSELQNNMVEIRDLSTQIATAAEQQSAVAHEISDNVIEISSMSEEAASGADKSAHDSEDLSALASRQKELLSQFKIV